MRFRVGDEFLDMDSSIIAQTFAVNEIGAIETRQGGFSNDFTIPLTANNQKILGSPGDINSASRNPYTKVDATLYDLGVPVAEGYLRFQVFDDNNLQASFFADNSNWYNLIKDKKLSDLDLSDYDHTWDYTTIAAAINADKDSGYTYPLIDYGTFGANTTLIVESTEMFPALFVPTIVTQILNDVGWKAAGEITEHPLYKRMIIPFSAKAFVHDLQWVADNTYTDTDPLPIAFATPAVKITWTTAAGTSITIATEAGKYTVTLTVTVATAANSLKVILLRNTVNVGSIGFVGISGSGDATFTLTVESLDLVPGDTIEATVELSLGVPASILRNADISMEPEQPISAGSTIQMAAVMPDIKQSDFLRYIAFIFGGILQANALSKTVTFSFFKSIKGNLDGALDWSNKIDIGSTREVDFTTLLNNYAKQSIMTYKDDSDDEELAAYESETGEIFGQGKIDINNDHIDGLKTIYEAPFTPMININSFNNTMYIPQIRYLNAAGELEKKPNPKIAILSKNIDVDTLSLDVYSNLRVTNPDNPGVEFEDISDIPFCWFAKTQFITEVDELLDSLVFDQINFPNVIGEPLKDRFLRDYEEILNSMKYLKAFLHLTEVDINALDFTIPVYIEFYKSYFYISKILNYQGSKKVTESELVKIG